MDKIKKVFLVTIPVLIFFSFVVFSGAFAYTQESLTVKPIPSLLDPLEYLKDILQSYGSADADALPFGLGGFLSDGGLISGDGLNLINTSNLSLNDLPGALKSVAILAINLFLIVIQTVAGVLRALLPFLQ